MKTLPALFVAGAAWLFSATPAVACSVNSVPTIGTTKSCSIDVMTGVATCQDGTFYQFDYKACAWDWSKPLTSAPVHEDPDKPWWKHTPLPKNISADCKVEGTEEKVKVTCPDGSFAVMDLYSQEWKWNGPRAGDMDER